MRFHHATDIGGQFAHCNIDEIGGGEDHSDIYGASPDRNGVVPTVTHAQDYGFRDTVPSGVDRRDGARADMQLPDTEQIYAAWRTRQRGWGRPSGYRPFPAT